MSEILDPRRPESMLPEIAIRHRAENLVGSAALRGELSPENIDSLAEGALAITEAISIDELKTAYTLSIASKHATHQLMDDRLGRSEHHIAGEVCRILNMARLIVFDEGIGELALLRPQRDPRDRNTAVWRPFDVAVDCPTIDGKIAAFSRPAVSRTGTPVVTQSHHISWLSMFHSATLPSLEGSYLTLLRPPFMLISGEIVAQYDPRYYIAHGSFDSSFQELPGILIDA